MSGRAGEQAKGWRPRLAKPMDREMHITPVHRGCDPAAEQENVDDAADQTAGARRHGRAKSALRWRSFTGLTGGGVCDLGSAGSRLHRATFASPVPRRCSGNKSGRDRVSNSRNGESHSHRKSNDCATPRRARECSRLASNLFQRSGGTGEGGVSRRYERYEWRIKKRNENQNAMFLGI